MIKNNILFETNVNAKKIKNELDMWNKNYHSNVPKDYILLWDEIDFERISSLVDTLEYWIAKEELSSGELTLAYANLGSVLESFLKFFYTIYISDSLEDEKYLFWKKEKKKEKYRELLQSNPTEANKFRKENVKQPDKLSFYNLIAYTEYVWEMENNPEDLAFLDSVRKKRNAIHSFNKQEIGTSENFKDDTHKTLIFLNKLIMRFPDLEIYNEFFYE